MSNMHKFYKNIQNRAKHKSNKEVSKTKEVPISRSSERMFKN